MIMDIISQQHTEMNLRMRYLQQFNSIQFQFNSILLTTETVQQQVLAN